PAQVDPDLVGPVRGHQHRERHEAAGPAVQPGALPDVAEDVPGDDLLQLVVPLVGGGDLLVGARGPEHVAAQRQPELVLLVLDHRGVAPSGFAAGTGVSKLEGMRRMASTAALESAANPIM